MNTAVDWFTPARRRQIAIMTIENDAHDRELNEAEARKALEAVMKDCVDRYLRKHVPTETSR